MAAIYRKSTFPPLSTIGERPDHRVVLFNAFMSVPVVVSVPVTLAALGLLVLAGRLTDRLLSRTGRSAPDQRLGRRPAKRASKTRST